jgi:L-threonylcarbamoyladenylate synthase
MSTQILPANESVNLEKAIDLLWSSQPVAFPTDTVYGLGAWLWDEQAVEQLFAVKGRDAAKAIAVLVGEAAHLSQVTKGMNSMAARLAERFWPGALTLVVDGHPDLPANLSPRPTVGVRMPDHPLALALLRRTGPLAVTSANRSDAPSAVTAQEVLEQLGGRIPLILDGGRTPGGLPSTVVDCTGSEPVILRPGPLSEEQLRRALKGNDS